MQQGGRRRAVGIHHLRPYHHNAARRRLPEARARDPDGEERYGFYGVGDEREDRGRGGERDYWRCENGCEREGHAFNPQQGFLSVQGESGASECTV